ncbi:hypothetical protein C5D07_01585 [Rathayibacter tritici]|nr:hypothetical protein C5D07_01585 [Rathayibacter tritici]
MADDKDLRRLIGLSLSTISKHDNKLPVRPENRAAIEAAAAAAELDVRATGPAAGARGAPAPSGCCCPPASPTACPPPTSTTSRSSSC